MCATHALPAPPPGAHGSWLTATASPQPLPGLPGGMDELDRYFDEHGVLPPARQIVTEIVQGDPARRVGGGRKNAVVRYASRKLGCVVQAESRTVEGAFVQYCEFTPEVVFYLCQPWKLSVSIVDARGRPTTIHTVVDFLLLDSRGFHFVECKSPGELRRDSECKHPRFVRENGRWRWPAAEDAARALGLGFDLFTSEDVNPIWLRNMRFLADYLDVPAPCDATQLERIQERLTREGSIRLCELLASTEVSTAGLWWLVAHGHIWCDLQHERLFETDQAWAHGSESRMLAQRHSRLPAAPSSEVPPVAPVRIEPGARVFWDEVPCTVVNRGAKTVTLQRAQPPGIVTLPLGEAETFIRNGQWRGDSSTVADALADARKRMLRRASDEDLSKAVARFRVVDHYQQHGAYPPEVNARVARRYLRWYKEGDQEYGSGFLGLIRFRGRPSGISRLPERQEQVLKEVLADLPTKEKAGRVASAYGRVKAICKKRKIEPAPCEETVRRRLEQNSIPEDERARRGARAAYQVQGPLPDSAASLRHGDRAWEVAHIDHTPLDIRLVSSKTATLLGTPWLTCYVDAYSRMPLSFTVSFDAPSRASVAAVLFDCVRRNHRLSDTIAFDQGAEFNSVLTESALAYLGVHKLERPAQKPRYGAVIERMFGTTNTALIHELNGNTTLLSLGRGLSSSHHPNQTAVWTLPLLHDALERWFFEIYANRVHSTLGDTPGAVFDRSVALSGARVARYIADDDGLRMLLAQPPRRGTTRRVAPVRGIVIDYLPYWHDDFQYGNVARTSVPVKIDVADCSVAFARVRGRWITCILTAGDADLYGRSWRQIHLAIESLHEKRRQGREARPMNAELIGGFLLECDDRALVLQVARDAEARLRSIAPAPAPAPERALVAQDAALPARAADAPSAVRPSSGQGVEPPASTIDDEPDYDQLETFDAR